MTGDTVLFLCEMVYAVFAVAVIVHRLEIIEAKIDKLHASADSGEEKKESGR